ncbi:MAG: PilZ domain-containing protein [Myxococcales bacterium]|nr:PilZ domain-containing protein [Myxococcales bacterium]
MKLVRARYRDGSAFMAAYQAQFECGGLFIPTRSQHELGTAVVVDVRFPELRNSISLRGFIAWRRPGRHRSKVRAGIGVEFLASERRKRDFLLGVARGEIVEMLPRRHRRVPVDVEIEWREKDDRSRFRAQLEDIGEGGAFVRTTDFRPVGSEVLLELTPPGSTRTVALQGRVAWTCHTEGEEGMGIEFRCRDVGGARRLKELVRRIETDQFEAVLTRRG